MHSRLSREELEGRFLGPMANLSPKGRGDNSMPGKQRSRPGVGVRRCGTRATWLKLNCLNPNLQWCIWTPTGKTPETGTTACGGIRILPPQPSGCGRCPMRAFKEMNGEPKSRSRTTETNAGSPKGREPYGDGGPVVVVGVTSCRGGGNTVHRAKRTRCRMSKSVRYA